MAANVVGQIFEGVGDTFSAVATVIAGAQSNKQARENRKEARFLADRERQDTLYQNSVSNRYAQQQLGENKRQFSLAFADKQEIKGYDRTRAGIADALSWINRQQDIRTNLANVWGKSAGGARIQAPGA